MTISEEVIERIEEAKRTHAAELDLSNFGLTDFPLEILELTNLEYLDLDGNAILALPEGIGNLTNLSYLDLDNNLLETLPESIGNLTNLEYLNLAGNKIAALPEGIGNLTNLSTLDLDNNPLETLPESIGNLTNLTSLSLDYTKLTKLPESFAKLLNLSQLIFEAEWNVFPEVICSLTGLTDLRFGGKNLMIFPDSIGKLTNLSVLYFVGSGLTSLPESIGNLTNLSELCLYDNQLTSLPELIGNLTELSTLNLSGNQLKSLPESIGNLTELSTLDLSGNQFTSLPESIGNLTNLTYLYLNENQLTSLPESIGNLTNLTYLYLNENQLTNLPETMNNLNKLEDIGLEGNRFEVGPEVYELPAQEQIQEILKWQRAQEAGTLRPIHEAKVIFIGESNYGKTHLIELLQNGEIGREITTTHGIERSHITVDHEGKQIRLNIWDLGGQEFMRSTHQFFFSERTLYVLVTLARRERNELNHWLKLADQLGNKAPVLVVINKIDKDAHDLDRKSLERDYPNIIGFVRTCIHDCKDAKAADTIEALKQKIITAVSDKDIMPGVFELRPPDWFTVKEQLEKLEDEGKDFISYKDYEDLEFIKDLPADERKSNLKLLSMIGAVVSYVDDPRLIDTNVINPQWIMDGVYAIINDPIVKDEKKGELHLSNLERILPPEKFPKARHVYLLELMQKFNLCYAANDKRDLFFIPDLFEDIEPEFDWDSDNTMHFRYNYDDFSPNAFMTRFIVEMNQDIVENKRWRSGVYISNGSCSAKVYQTYRKNYIHVEVTGNKGEGRSYLYTIREAFRKLHKPYPEMNIQQEVLYKGHWLDYLELIELEKVNETKYHTKLKERLPVTEILNGYSTSIDRKGALKNIKIFLASSSELKDEREKFELFIHRENKQLYKQGVFLELVIWEDFIDAMSKTRLQDEYNKAVRNSDIFVSLFFTKVGKYTQEEFEIAFGQFKKTGKPLVYTYFKDAPIHAGKITSDIKSLLAFQEKLKELGHYRTVYINIDNLKLQFKKQLEKILPSLL